MTAVEVLRKAKELIADPARWCQGKSACDEHGVVRSLKDQEAVAFCAEGALGRISDDPWRYRLVPLMCQAARELYCYDHIYVNDQLGHGAVMKVFDRAIELAEEADALAREQA